MSAQKTRFGLPAFSLPLYHHPAGYTFLNALNYYDVDAEDFGRNGTYREIVMRQIMNSITDKPEWNRKVFDNEITTKWCQEVADSGRDGTPKMIGVVISDTAISPELQRELQSAVSPLVAAPKKDFQPGSDDKVVDLVHPSLFPVIYGRSRVLPDQVMGLDDCLDRVGEGHLLPVPPENGQAVLPAPYHSAKGFNGCPVILSCKRWRLQHRILYQQPSPEEEPITLPCH